MESKELVTGGLTEDELMKMKYDDLQKLAKEAGVPASGTKADIVARLLEKAEESDEDVPEDNEDVEQDETSEEEEEIVSSETESDEVSDEVDETVDTHETNTEDDTDGSDAEGDNDSDNDVTDGHDSAGRDDVETDTENQQSLKDDSTETETDDASDTPVQETDVTDENISEVFAVGARIQLMKPVTTYRGPSRSFAGKSFGGVITVLDSVNDEFLRVSFVRSGLGLCEAFVLTEEVSRCQY